ncbi:MAG: Flp family type IVb pilin [Methylophilus sp.]
MFNLIKTACVNLISDEEGASAIEYALIAAMVAIALVTFVQPINTAITTIFTNLQTALT